MNQDSITCEEAAFLLGSLADGELTSALEQHVASCEACAELAEEQALLWELLLADAGASGVPPAPSPGFTSRVVAAAVAADRRPTQRGRNGGEGGGVGIPTVIPRGGGRRAGLSLAAAVLVAIGLVWGGAHLATSGPAIDGVARQPVLPGTDQPLDDDSTSQADETWVASVEELLEDLPEEDRVVVAFLDVSADESIEQGASADAWLVEQIEEEDADAVSPSDRLALELAAGLAPDLVDLGDF